MPRLETPKCECGYSVGLIRDGEAYRCGTCLITERDRYRAALELIAESECSPACATRMDECFCHCSVASDALAGKDAR